MLRRKFIEITLAAAPLTAAGFPSSATDRVTKGFNAKKGEGRYHGHIPQRGANSGILDVKVSGKDTNGDLVVFDLTSHSPKHGAPVHVHPHQDETFIVQEGEYVLVVGGSGCSSRPATRCFCPATYPTPGRSSVPRPA